MLFLHECPEFALCTNPDEVFPIWEWEKDELSDCLFEMLAECQNGLMNRDKGVDIFSPEWVEATAMKIISRNVPERFKVAEEAGSGSASSETAVANEANSQDNSTDTRGPSASVGNSHIFQRTYFSMPHIHLLHKMCSGRHFEGMSPGDMYQVFNLLDCPRQLKPMEGEKARICYLIYFLGEMIPQQYRRKWRKAMRDALGITSRYYNSKYKEAENGSRDNVRFLDRLEELKEQYRDLEEA